MPIPAIIGGAILGAGRVVLVTGGRAALGGPRASGRALRRPGAPDGDRDTTGVPYKTRVHGLPEMRRALRRVGNAADKAIEEELRAVAVSVSAKAQARAPVRTGKLRASIKPSVTVKRGAAVVSNVPYAKVHEWGGVIHPRGVPIHIPRSGMVTGAVESSDMEIARAVDRIGDRIERAWTSDTGLGGGASSLARIGVNALERAWTR